MFTNKVSEYEQIALSTQFQLSTVFNSIQAVKLQVVNLLMIFHISPLKVVEPEQDIEQGKETDILE